MFIYLILWSVKHTDNKVVIKDVNLNLFYRKKKIVFYSPPHHTGLFLRFRTSLLLRFTTIAI